MEKQKKPYSQGFFDTCDLTNARFFADSTIDHCTFIRSDLRSVGIARRGCFYELRIFLL